MEIPVVHAASRGFLALLCADPTIMFSYFLLYYYYLLLWRKLALNGLGGCESENNRSDVGIYFS